MKTIIINQDGTCLEFKSKESKTPDKLLSINAHTQVVILLHGRPAMIQVVAFESCDIGERVSTGSKILFLRGNTLLIEFPLNKNIAHFEAKEELQAFFTTEGVHEEIHKPVFDGEE